MLRRILLVVFVGIIICKATLQCDLALAQDTVEKEKKGIFELIKKPISTILKPVYLDGLADIGFRTVDGVLDGVRTVTAVDRFTDIVITPSRTKEYTYNINKNVSVVDQKYIDKTNPKNVQESLCHEVGIFLPVTFSNNKDNNIVMRGFSETGLSNTLIMVDGRRLNQIDLSGSDISQIDVRSIDQIEIIRGANSVLYGDNATAGVINIRTKKGDIGHHIQYIQEVGSYNRHKEYFSIDGKEDFLSYFFSYSYEEDKGYRQNNNYLGNNILYNMTLHASDFLDFEFSFGYHRDNYGQPGALYGQDITNNGRRATIYPNDKGKTKDYFFTWNPIIYLDRDFSQTQFSCLTTYRKRQANSSSFWTGGGSYQDLDIGSFEIKPKIESKIELMHQRIENKVVFGVDYFKGKNDISSGYFGSGPSILDVHKRTVGTYFFNKMLIDKKFIFNTGFRGDYAKFSFDQTSPSSFHDKNYLNEWAVNASVGYKYNDRSQIYFDYQRSYRYPVTDELFSHATEWTVASLDTSLKAQTANNFEIGIKDNSFDIVNLEADYFFIDTENEIYLDPDISVYANKNYPKTFRHGLELEINAQLFDFISGFFNYTFQKAEFLGGKYLGKDIPDVPTNMFSFGFDVKPTEGFEINVVNKYVGSRYIVSDPSNTYSQSKAYFKTDLNLLFKVKELMISGSVKNLFNTKYNSYGIYGVFSSKEAFYPAPQRRFELTVSAKF